MTPWKCPNLEYLPRVSEVIGQHEGRDFSFLAELPHPRTGLLQVKQVTCRHILGRDGIVGDLIPSRLYEQ